MTPSLSDLHGLAYILGTNPPVGDLIRALEQRPFIETDPAVQSALALLGPDPPPFWRRQTPLHPFETGNVRSAGFDVLSDPRVGVLAAARDASLYWYLGGEAKNRTTIWRWEGRWWSPVHVRLPDALPDNNDLAIAMIGGAPSLLVYADQAVHIAALPGEAVRTFTHARLPKTRALSLFSATAAPDGGAWILIDNLLFRTVGGTLQLVHEAQYKIVSQLESDPRSGMLWGCSGFGDCGYSARSRVYRFTGQGWEEVAHDAQAETLCWSASRQKMVVLQRERKENTAFLAEITPDGSTPISGPILNTADYIALSLGEGDGHWVCFGEQGAYNYRTRGVTMITEGGTFRSAQRAGYPVLLDGARVSSAAQAVLYDPVTLAAYVYRAAVERWVQVVPPKDARGEGEHFFTSNLNFLALPGGGHRLLDSEGRLWGCQDGVPWALLAGPEGGPGGRHLMRVALGWDPLGQQLVAFGGSCDNRTFTWSPRAGWTELDDPVRPPHGLGMMATTPSGLYLLRLDELWRFVDGGWVCVGVSSRWDRRVLPSYEEDDFRLALLYDPRRDLLLATLVTGELDDDGGDRDHHLAAWAGDDWQIVAHLPTNVSASAVHSPSSHVALDAENDQLWICTDRGGALTMPLAALSLPAGGLPTAPVRPRRALEAPPGHLLRGALSLSPLPAPRVRIASLPLDIPADFEVMAVLPYHPEMGCSPWFAALLIGHRSAGPLRGSLRPRHDIDECYTVLPLKAWDEPRPLVSDGAAHLKPMRWVRFQEVPPSLTTDRDGPPLYNSLPGDQEERAYGTKLGGFARYVQELNVADETVSVQLGADHFCIGDMGRMFIVLWEGGGRFTTETH